MVKNTQMEMTQWATLTKGLSALPQSFFGLDVEEAVYSHFCTVAYVHDTVTLVCRQNKVRQPLSSF